MHAYDPKKRRPQSRRYEGTERRRWPRHEASFSDRDEPYYGGSHSQRFDWPARASDNSFFDRAEGNYQAGGGDFQDRMRENWPGYGRDSGGQLSYESRRSPWESAEPPRGGIWRRMRNFFGVGPKGYTRSDERIREDACEALAAHPEVDASDIEVLVSGGIVTLRGTVGSRWMKRLAEDALERVPGVAEVHMELRISSTGDREEERGSVL